MRSALSLLLLLALAGCAQPGRVALVTPTPIVSTPAATAPLLVSLPSATPHRSVAPAQLASLRNLSAEDLAQRLGPPDFKRQEATAQIWQYRGRACVLDVFLYAEGGDLKVAHAVTRSRTDIAAPEDHCDPASG
jgi:hypothetical protein